MHPSDMLTIDPTSCLLDLIGAKHFTQPGVALRGATEGLEPPPLPSGIASPLVGEFGRFCRG